MRRTSYITSPGAILAGSSGFFSRSKLSHTEINTPSVSLYAMLRTLVLCGSPANIFYQQLCFSYHLFPAAFLPGGWSHLQPFLNLVTLAIYKTTQCPKYIKKFSVYFSSTVCLFPGTSHLPPTPDLMDIPIPS